MKNIVVIGGGTGTFTVLTALKKYPVHLTAIVSMADDGGSTGILRDQYGVLPAGDVRRALVALSDSSEVMRNLFNYRFKGGGLQEHNFGNLFLAALEKVTGNFSSAVLEASNILNINGEVAPVTLDDVRLCARLADGKIIRGETNIDIPRTLHRAAITEVWLEPEAQMNPSLKRILNNADVIVIGPGDLYTSVIPNLLVRGVKEEIKKSKAKKVFICNLMTKRGETDRFNGRDFLGVIEKHLGKNVLDFAIFNNKKPPERLLKKYRREGAEFVEPPTPSVSPLSSSPLHKGKKQKYILGDFIDTDKLVRHGPLRKLGKLLASL